MAMQLSEDMIRNVVSQVLAEVGRIPPLSNGCGSYHGRFGIFTDCQRPGSRSRPRVAFEQLSEKTIEDRKRIIDHIRRISIDQCEELGTMEMERNASIGRLPNTKSKSSKPSA